MRTTKGSTGGVNLEALLVMSKAEAAAIAKSAYMTLTRGDEERTTKLLEFSPLIEVRSQRKSRKNKVMGKESG